MNLTKTSALARPIYWNYHTNQLIVLLTVALGIVFGILSLMNGNGLGEAAVDGFWAAAATITAWVLAREVDPDHDYSAFVGAIAAPFLIGQSFGLFAMAILILFARLVNRSVGPKATLWDSIGLAVLLGLALFIANPWVLGLAGMLAFLLDAILMNPNRQHLLFAGVALGIAIADAIFQGVGEVSLPDGIHRFGSVAVTLIFVGTIVLTHDIRTIPDRETDTPMNTQRVQVTMGLVLFGALLVAIWEGNGGVNDLIPAWTAMAGVVLYRVGKQIVR
jgi:hypothetical protein